MRETSRNIVPAAAGGSAQQRNRGINLIYPLRGCGPLSLHVAFPSGGGASCYILGSIHGAIYSSTDNDGVKINAVGDVDCSGRVSRLEVCANRVWSRVLALFSICLCTAGW